MLTVKELEEPTLTRENAEDVVLVPGYEDEYDVASDNEDSDNECLVDSYFYSHTTVIDLFSYT